MLLCSEDAEAPADARPAAPFLQRKAIFTGDFLDLSSIETSSGSSTSTPPDPPWFFLFLFRAAHPLLLLRRDGPRLRSAPSAVFSGEEVCRPARLVTCVLLYL